MKASQLISKLQEEMRKYGDIPVILSTQHEHEEPVDVATFTTDGERNIWISSEEA